MQDWSCFLNLPASVYSLQKSVASLYSAHSCTLLFEHEIKDATKGAEQSSIEANSTKVYKNHKSPEFISFAAVDIGDLATFFPLCRNGPLPVPTAERNCQSLYSCDYYENYNTDIDVSCVIDTVAVVQSSVPHKSVDTCGQRRTESCLTHPRATLAPTLRPAKTRICFPRLCGLPMLWNDTSLCAACYAASFVHLCTPIVQW